MAGSSWCRARLLLVLCSASIPVWASWQSAGPFGGTAQYVAVDPQNPNTILAGSVNSLLYRSADRGESWSRLAFPRNFSGSIRTILIDSKDSSHYLVGVQVTGSRGAGLYQSRDAGESWEAVPDLAENSVEALAVFPGDSTRIVAGTRNGVHLSTDNGDHWKRISPPENQQLLFVTAVAFHSSDANVILAGTSHLPWKTVDGGASWASIHTGMIDDSDVFSVYVDPAEPQRVFASACSGIYRSDSGGDRWVKAVGIPSTHRRTHVITVQPGSAGIVFAGTTLGLLKSLDGGMTWKVMNRHDVNSIAFDPTDPKTFYMATSNAGVWRSSDGGETVRPLNDGFVVRSVGRVISSGGKLYANTLQGAEFGGVFVSPDRGRSWNLLANAEALKDGNILSLASSSAHADLLFAFNESHILKSVDRGRSWNPTLSQPTIYQRGVGRVPLRINSMIVMDGGKPVVVAGTQAGLFRSVDAGATWVEVRLNSQVGTPVLSIHAASDGGKTLLIRTPKFLYVTTDGAGKWQQLPPPVDPSRIYDLAVAPGNAGPILAATAEGIYQSGSAGMTWSQSKSGISDETVSALRYHPVRLGEVYAVQFGRLFRSGDSGTTWNAVPDAALRGTFVKSLSFFPEAPDRLFAVTVDTGLIFLDLNS